MAITITASVGYIPTLKLLKPTKIIPTQLLAPLKTFSHRKIPAVAMIESIEVAELTVPTKVELPNCASLTMSEDKNRLNPM